LQQEEARGTTTVAFGDLGDVCVNAEPLSYVLVVFRLVGTFVGWMLLSLLAWGAFSVGAIWPLLLSLLTFSLQGGLWNEIKRLERSLGDFELHGLESSQDVASQAVNRDASSLNQQDADQASRLKKRAAMLNRLDARYGLMLEIIRLLSHQKQQVDAAASGEGLTAILKLQRYRIQANLVRLRPRYYPLLDKILGDRDRAERNYLLTERIVKQAIAEFSMAPSDVTVQDRINRLEILLEENPDLVLLEDVRSLLIWTSPVKQDRARSLPPPDVAVPQPAIRPVPQGESESFQFSVRNPVGNFIADLRGKSKKYHFQEDCQIWKSLMYDFMMEHNDNLVCDRSAEIFERNGLQPCSVCAKKNK